jgi:hypothetical protein
MVQRISKLRDIKFCFGWRFALLDHKMISYDLIFCCLLSSTFKMGINTCRFNLVFSLSDTDFNFKSYKMACQVFW